MYFEKWYPVDLVRLPAHIQDVGMTLFVGDADSIRIGVNVTRDGAEETVTGAVKGIVILPDGSDILPFNGSSDGSRAWIDLPGTALVMSGRVQIALRVYDDGAVTTLLAVSATVRRADADRHFDPDDVVGDITELISEAERVSGVAETAAGQAQAALEQASNIVSYEAQSGQTDAEKAQARQNIDAESETRASALRGFLNYGYGTPATDHVGSAYYTRSGIMLTITGSNGNSPVPIRIRLNGAMSVGSTGTVPAAWDDALALVTGHTYRWKVRQVSGTGSKPVLARVFAGRSYTLVSGAVTDDRDYESVCVFTYADTPVNLCMVYARGGGATFTDCVVECVLTEVYGEQELPSAPTRNGTYVLKCTVENGIPTFSWVSEGSGLLGTPLTLTGGDTE